MAESSELQSKAGYKIVPVNEWPMDSYPERDRISGKILFSVWRLVYPGPQGQVRWKNFPPDKWEDEDAKMIRSHGRGHLWTRPQAEDILVNDRAIFNERGGRSYRMLVGLWHYWDGKKWEEQNSKLEPCPKHWLDCTREYEKDWRPEAYEGQKDPFYGSKTMEVTNPESLKTEVAKQQEEIARLKQQLSQARQGNTNG